MTHRATRADLGALYGGGRGYGAARVAEPPRLFGRILMGGGVEMYHDIPIGRLHGDRRVLYGGGVDLVLVTRLRGRRLNTPARTSIVGTPIPFPPPHPATHARYSDEDANRRRVSGASQRPIGCVFLYTPVEKLNTASPTRPALKSLARKASGEKALDRRNAGCEICDGIRERSIDTDRGGDVSRRRISPPRLWMRLRVHCGPKIGIVI